MGALAPVPGQSVYGASKSAVKLFTEGLYAETMGTGVNVTIVFPGAIATGISANSDVGVRGPAVEAAPPVADAEAVAAVSEAPAVASDSLAGNVKAAAGKVAGTVTGAIGGLVNRVRGKEDSAEAGSFPTTEPAVAAQVMIEAIKKGSYRATIGKDAAGLDKLSRLNPKGATEMIAKRMASLIG